MTTDNQWYIDSEVTSGSLIIVTLKQKGDETKWYIPKDYLDQLRLEAQLEQVKIDFENNLKLLDAEVLKAKKELAIKIYNMLYKETDTKTYEIEDYLKKIMKAKTLGENK